MSTRILSPSFIRLAGATSAFFLGFAMLIPLLPRYLVATGKSPTEVGILLGAFSVSALFLRPVIGREIDRRGRKRFLVAGLALSAVASAGYVTAEGFLPLLALRLLHGVGIACFYPSAAAVAADLAPDKRRAEMISYFSMFLYAGMALGPVIAETIAPPRPEGIDPAYFIPALLVAAALPAAGVLVALTFRDQELPHEPGLAAAPLLNRAAMFPALILSLCAIGWSATPYVPLYAAQAGFDTRLFFFVMAATVIGMRFFVGRAADVYGRRAVVVPGTLFAGAGVLVLTATPVASLPVLVVSAFVFGIGWGALFPGLMTLTLDRVTARGRGSAVGTFTAAFDVSFGAGQAVLGVIWGLAGFRAAFALSGAACVVACIVFMSGYSRSAVRHPAIG